MCLKQNWPHGRHSADSSGWTSHSTRYILVGGSSSIVSIYHKLVSHLWEFIFPFSLPLLKYRQYQQAKSSGMSPITFIGWVLGSTVFTQQVWLLGFHTFDRGCLWYVMTFDVRMFLKYIYTHTYVISDLAVLLSNWLPWPHIKASFLTWPPSTFYVRNPAILRTIQLIALSVCGRSSKSF